MPSENKTPNYGLNQWQGNEYVKRQDFVDDNLKIDTELKRIENKVDGIEVPVTSINDKTGAVTLSAFDVGAASKIEFDEHLADTMPHRFVDAGKTYRYGLSVVNGVVTMNYEEVI